MPLVDISRLQTFTAVNLNSDAGAVGGPVVVPQAAQIRLLWTNETGRIANNILYGRYSGGFAGTVAQADAILTELTTGAEWTALAAFLSSQGGLAGVGIRDVNTAFQPEIRSAGGGALGTSASASLPLEIAGVVSLRTARVGRGYRGRFYVPEWATNALGAGNVMAAGAVTALQNWAANKIRAAFSAQGYTLVLGLRERKAYTSPSTGVEHPARAATTEAVTQLLVRDNHWDTQRRRGLE